MSRKVASRSLCMALKRREDLHHYLLLQVKDEYLEPNLFGVERQKSLSQSYIYVQQLKIKVISFHLIPAVTGAV
jgi:hypothetical protein